MIVEVFIMIWLERITSRSFCTAEPGSRPRPTIQSFSHPFIHSVTQSLSHFIIPSFLLGYLPNLTDFCSL